MTVRKISRIMTATETCYLDRIGGFLFTFPILIISFMCLQPLQEVFCSNSSGIILIPHFPHALFPGFILLLNISIVRVAAHTHSPGNIYFLQGLFHSIRIYRCIKCPFRTMMYSALMQSEKPIEMLIIVDISQNY